MREPSFPPLRSQRLACWRPRPPLHNARAGPAKGIPIGFSARCGLNSGRTLQEHGYNMTATILDMGLTPIVILRNGVAPGKGLYLGYSHADPRERRKPDDPAGKAR